MLDKMTNQLGFQGNALILRAERQRIIASNIANADTPGYVSRDFDFAKTLREAAEAQMARLKLAEMQGDVIRIAAVQTQLATVFATVRDALLQIPARMAPVLAAETDPVAVHNVLHAEIHQALQHLAGASDRLTATAAET